MPTLYDRPTADTKTAPSPGDRVRALRREADDLEEQQHADLMRLIATNFHGEVFSAADIWRQPDLASALADAGIRSPMSLGRWLRRWCGAVCRDADGTVWRVDETDLHEDAGIPIDDGV